MSQIADRLHVWLAALLHAGGPTLVFGIAGALLGVLVVIALMWVCGRLAGLRSMRSVSVAALAAGGISRAGIARRTGLSQDAVGMLLHVRATHPGRRKLPVTARIAASDRANARRRNRDWNPQVVVNTQDRVFVGGLEYAAQPLPFNPSTFDRLTRSGQAA